MSLFLLAYARAGNERKLRSQASSSKDAGEEAKGASACFAREQGVLSSLIVICLLWDMSLGHLRVRALTYARAGQGPELGKQDPVGGQAVAVCADLPVKAVGRSQCEERACSLGF